MKRSTAQALYVIDPISPASQLPAHDTNLAKHEHSDKLQELLGNTLEVSEPGEISIVVEELPGAPPGTVDPEPVLEVSEEPITADDANEAKKEDPKASKWDWQKSGANGFVEWIKSRLAEVPKHSGLELSGLQRAEAFLDKLDNEISKAMRMDLDGELDANMIEKVRAEIDDGISRLQARMDKVKKSKKSNRKKRAEYEIDEDGFIKEAQKITGVQGTYVMVPLLISSLARTIINGMVSAGHDLNVLYATQTEKYNLNDREQLELRQLLFDMGLPMRIDMGIKPDEHINLNEDTGQNWSTFYPENSWGK